MVLLRRFALPLLFCALLLAPGCPKNNGDGDGGTPDASGDGGGTDGGGVDAGPTLCRSDYECDTGEICEDATGDCIAGNACNPSLGFANCNFPTDGAGCGMTGPEDCVCDPADSICRERRILCEPCASNEQCGNHPLYDRPADCVSYGGETVCLAPAGTRGCPQGYEPDANNVCVPAGGDCASVFACVADADCPPARPICNLSTGTCAKGCVFDLETGDSTCASNQVCHEDGKCRLPCDPQNDNCADFNPEFICKEDTGGNWRCRHDGCIDNIECEVPQDSPYVGFCELTSHACVLDRCRPERTEADGSNPDCKLPNRCDNSGACVPMTCLERGGAPLACLPNNICCGECRNVLGNPSRDACDPWACNGSETPQGEPALDGCVIAPNPPWCQSCGDDAECAGSNPVEDARDTGKCLNNVCSPTCQTNTDCPTLWGCQYLFAGCDPTQPDQCGTGGSCVDDAPYGPQCTSDNDCNTDAGQSCVADPADGVQKCHAAFNVCDCTSGGAPADTNCPTDTRCAETGFQKHRCVATKVCLPGQDLCQ
ncbi:MAG: hypothetical protein P1V51_16470 [Deltaproteobacteria bacterium]|nr:hypothetical protein [Deltaproteobacteria bacterium]